MQIPMKFLKRRRIMYSCKRSVKILCKKKKETEVWGNLGLMPVVFFVACIKRIFSHETLKKKDYLYRETLIAYHGQNLFCGFGFRRVVS